MAPSQHGKQHFGTQLVVQRKLTKTLHRVALTRRTLARSPASWVMVAMTLCQSGSAHSAPGSRYLTMGTIEEEMSDAGEMTGQIQMACATPWLA
jgi:hypothetical protein